MDAARKGTADAADCGDPSIWPPEPPWPEVDLELPDPLWVFGYGSLMWKPGFSPAESRIARLYGFHRGLCIWSWIYRGTERDPGLVLGLGPGGSCLGVAHLVRAEERELAAAYLYKREMVTSVYVPVVRDIRLDDGRKLPALTFVADKRHQQYAGDLSPEEAAAIVQRARGRSGANVDYVSSTCACLDELGIPCPRLHKVNALLGRE